MYQEVCLNRGTEAGVGRGGEINVGYSLSPLPLPPVIFCLLRAWVVWLVINELFSWSTNNLRGLSAFM